jgi:hypothetical protein
MFFIFDLKCASQRFCAHIRRLCSWGICIVLIAVCPPKSFAQSDDVKNSLRRCLWTAESIRTVRATRDYNALLAMIITEAAGRGNLYPTANALKDAISKAQQLAAAAPEVSLDPDLNPAKFREMLRRLQNTGIVPQDTLNDLLKELSRSPAEMTEEELILREQTVATKATFANFLQQHILAVYDMAGNANVRAIISNPVGSVSLPDVNIDVVALAGQSHIPDGVVKTAMLNLASTGTVDVANLRSVSATAINDAAAHFAQARNAFQAIVSGQPKFDTILTNIVPPNLQDRVAAVRQLVNSTPDQLEQFDTLRLVGSVLPLPPDVSKTVQTVAQIGSSIESTVSTVSHVASSLSTLGSVANLGMSFLTTGGLGALAGSLGSILGGGGPSNQEILDAVNRVGQQVQELHTVMVSRFDQVDRELKTINAKLDNGFATLGAQLAHIDADLRTVVATTSSIELAILQDRDTLQRAVINNIGTWNDNASQELHRNLVELFSAIDRADAHSDDMTRTDFRRLARYFTTLARTEVGKGALTGVQAADVYTLGFAATRLSRQTELYPVNYTMSFPISGDGTPTLQSMLAGAEGTRDLTTTPFVNERVWAIAANALATMVERWPNFANEIPSLRDAFDAVINNGKDLSALAKAIRTPESLPSRPLSGPYVNLLQSYQQHVDGLRGAFRQALRDEASNLSTSLGLSPGQAKALLDSFVATQGTQDAVMSGPWIVLRNLDYTPASVNATLCDGSGPVHQIAGAPLTGPGIQMVREANVLNTGVLSACIEVPGYVSTRIGDPVDHGGYGIVGHGAPCAALTQVTYGRLRVNVRFMFRLLSQPNDAAHRTVVAEASVIGPETELEGKIIGQPHWSGQPTEEGHDWNSECHNPNAWQIGMTNGFYVGNAAYVNNNWPTIAAGLSQSYYASGSYPYASGSQNEALTTMRNEDTAKLRLVYSRFVVDLSAILNKPPAPQNHIADVTPIVNEVSALEGLRALFREVTTIGYERTLARDDVLSGLLFGTESLPDGTEFRRFAVSCTQADRAQHVESCVADMIQMPSNRVQRLADRLTLVNNDLNAGRSSESHKLVEMTLDRLLMTRCLVPKTYNGGADCNANQ